MSTVKVGAATTTADDARTIVREYLSQPEMHWAYPAYDGYPGSGTDLVGPQDLFAPTLLNAGLRSIRSYDELVASLPDLNRRLIEVPLRVDLRDADEAAIGAVVELFGFLDDAARPHGVGGTRLAKIVHRKRPALVPLWDAKIAWCYQHAANAPVPPDKGRTWRSFTRLWLDVVREDLQAASAVWDELAVMTPPDGPRITALRALDIVGWRLGVRGTGTPEDDSD